MKGKGRSQFKTSKEKSKEKNWLSRSNKSVKGWSEVSFYPQDPLWEAPLRVHESQEIESNGLECSRALPTKLLPDAPLQCTPEVLKCPRISKIYSRYFNRARINPSWRREGKITTKNSASSIKLAKYTRTQTMPLLPFPLY